MKKDENEALLKLAQADDRSFFHFLIGWMSARYHDDMAQAARVWMTKYGDDGSRKKLAEFDAAQQGGEERIAQGFGRIDTPNGAGSVDS